MAGSEGDAAGVMRQVRFNLFGMPAVLFWIFCMNNTEIQRR